MRDLLSLLGYWRMIMGEAKPPLPPRATIKITEPEGTGATTRRPSLSHWDLEPEGTRTTTRRPSLSHWDLEPEASDNDYMTKYEKFYGEYEKYQEKLLKASGTIPSTLEQSIPFKFNNLN